MNSVVRVLIGDDHRIVREGLKQVLGDPANYLVSVNMQTRTIVFGQIVFNLTSN